MGDETRKGPALTVSRKEEAKAEVEAKSKIVCEWMQDLLKEPIPGKNLQEKLSDGVVLCKVANAIKPGCIRKFHRKPKMLMMKLENIAFFLAVCKSRFSVPQDSLFSPQDIHETTEDGQEDPNTMLRVLTVLFILIKAGGYNVAGLDSIDLEPKEPSAEVTVTPKADSSEPTPSTATKEPEPEPEPEPEVDTAAEDKKKAEETATAEKAAAEKAAAEKAAAEKAAAEKAAAEKAAAEKVAAEKVAAEKLASEKALGDKAASEKAAAEKAASEKAAAEKAATEKAAAEKAAAEKLAKEKAAAEKLASEKVAAEKLASEKAAAEKLAAEKATAEKLAKEKAAAEKLAAEKAAAEKAKAFTSISTPTPTATGTGFGTWYLKGTPNDHVDIQPQVTAEILNCIHNELSHESKVNVLRSIETHARSIQEKVLYSSDKELRQLCYDMGLGNTLAEVPEGKERKFYVEWILKYGRSK